MPAKRPEFATGAIVTTDVLVDLVVPKLFSARRAASSSTRMSMPEAAVHENDYSKPGQHNVRATGKRLLLKPIPISHRVQEFTDNTLGLGVPRTNPGHDFRSFFFRKNVSHINGLL